MLILITLCSCTMKEKTHYLDSVSGNDNVSEPVVSENVRPQANSQKENPQSDGKYSPLNYEKVEGVWISYIEYGWALTQKSESEFTQNIIQMFDNLKEKNINTVIVQVRSHGDAYYKSVVYPYSLYVSGTVDGIPDFDPLAIMVEQAHARSLSIHAWINPYRLMKSDNMLELSDKYKIKQWYQQDEYMTEKDSYWYLNPANVEVRELIFSGVREIIENYNVDAVQIDDYFYVPSPAMFNQNEQTARQSTTDLVKGIYDTIKTHNPAVEFGVSPAGNFTDTPRSDATQFTDLNLWCTQDGYLDYVAPQIYWAFDDSVAPFSEVLEKWKNLCEGGGKKLVVGLAAYKFPESEMLEQQAQTSLETDGVDGFIYFRYDNIA